MRRLATLLTLLVLASPLYLSEAEAVVAEVCSPTPEVPESFCVTHETTAAATTSGSRVRFSFSNTSQGFPNDQTTWIDTISLDMLDTGGASPVTSGATLPNDLRIAGGDGDCTSADFANCDAGSGTFAALISGNSGGALVNGQRDGTFGITEITNVNPPLAGTAQFLVSAIFCIDLAIDICDTAQTTITIADTVGGVTQATLSGGQTIPITTGGGTADVTFATLTTTLQGQSSTLSGGAPAGQTFTILRMPPNCTTGSGAGTFTSRAPARTVNVPQAVQVANCTTTSVRAKAGRKIKVSGLVTEGDAPDAFSPGTNVTVQLLAKKRGGFKVKATQQVPFNEATRTFAASFKSPNATKCKIVATFPGDANHGPSTGTRGVRC